MPFIDLASQYQRIKETCNANIQAVLDGGQYILGPSVEKLERELADYCGAKHVISVSSGTDAIFMPLLAMDLGPEDAVFLPSFTYTSTAEAVLLARATPVFVDVDPATFNIDCDHLRQTIADVRREGRLKPRAIITVDLFGQPADYETINTIAEEENLFVIADAAQAFGGASGDRKIGSLTHCTATSFYPSKPLGCYGDGGAIFTDDDGLNDILRSVRSHGKGTHKYDVVRVGVNGRLDAIQAAVLSAKLEVFDDELDARERVARIYDDRLKDVVAVPARVPNSRSAWAQYTIKTDDRDNLQASAKAAGVPTMIFYPRPMHLQPAYEKYGNGEGSLPVSEMLGGQVLSLPMNPYLSDETVHAICDAICGHFSGGRAA
ncbi:DegT/DnrJ/EryC1/StrS family aminotransferase [Oricola thermophila]|uniref:DegT/DnrJ/EryC1/StrS family aminotransferase n=1 Tax=Oricola thermophila TaxID=2742145 RepID=A0A6N1VNV3_9HYPH|nr:DegT/DnrJ/EryC1/StrS family aminotransferase [Oricola thermophila]QKV20617.1 DegT/DnrJ/EryC1/StrS family aminotransferase [Oricola thermophila]